MRSPEEFESHNDNCHGSVGTKLKDVVENLEKNHYFITIFSLNFIAFLFALDNQAQRTGERPLPMVMSNE